MRFVLLGWWPIRSAGWILKRGVTVLNGRMICSWRLYCLYFDHTGDARDVGARDCEGEEGQGRARGEEGQEPEEDWVSLLGNGFFGWRVVLTLGLARRREMRRSARRRVDSADPWLDFGRLSLLNLLIDKNPFFFVNAPSFTPLQPC